MGKRGWLFLHPLGCAGDEMTMGVNPAPCRHQELSEHWFPPSFEGSMQKPRVP